MHGPNLGARLFQKLHQGRVGVLIELDSDRQSLKGLISESRNHARRRRRFRYQGWRQADFLQGPNRLGAARQSPGTVESNDDGFAKPLAVGESQ